MASSHQHGPDDHGNGGHSHGGHSHGGHGHGSSSFRRLGITLVLVVVYLAAEVVGGILTGSLALLSDAGHMLSDAGALSLSLFALWMARRPRTPERTYGYLRFEILAALVNGVTLVLIAVFIAMEAWERFADPPEVAGGPMLVIAAGGLVVNLIGMAVLHGGRDDSLNLRGAWLHVLTDALGSAQALVAGGLIWAFGWHWADPVAALLIALLVVGSAWTLLRDSVSVLMEATPRHLDPRAVASAMAAVPGVEDVHDLHIWTITSGFDALSAHVRVGEDETGAGRDRIRAAVRRQLEERFGIEHATLELEVEGTCAHGCD